MSATFRADLVKPYFPGIEVIPEIEAAAPHQKVHFWHGKSFAHVALNGSRGEQKAGTLPKSAEKLRLAVGKEKTVFVPPTAATAAKRF